MADELRRGSKGSDVEHLQQVLEWLGFSTNGADGDFGGLTEDAVEAFQAANGYEITGVVDAAMWVVLLAHSAARVVEPIIDTVAGVLGGSPTADQLVDLCLAQVNDVYSNDNFPIGTENPEEFDCSGLLEWACHQLGVEPKLPGWSTGQRDHCHDHGLARSVDQARGIAGALLYWDNPGQGMNHVALSLGDGVHMVDANGTFDRVSVHEIDSVGFQDAGLIPGITYPESS